MASEVALQPDADMPHYAASKAGLVSLTKSLSKACTHDDVLVSVVSPGVIATPAVEEMAAETVQWLGTSVAEVLARFLAKRRPHLELRRPSAAEEVAVVVLFLASGAASFMTGTTTCASTKVVDLLAETVNPESTVERSVLDKIRKRP